MLCHISLTEMCWVMKLTMYGIKRKNLLYIICNNLSIGILCPVAKPTGPLFRYTATFSRTDSVSQWIFRGSFGLWYLKFLMPEIKFFMFSNSEFVCLCHSHAVLANTNFQSSTFRVTIALNQRLYKVILSIFCLQFHTFLLCSIIVSANIVSQLPKRWKIDCCNM